jgi:hypothetical protein
MSAELMDEIAALRSQIEALSKQMPSGAEPSQPGAAPNGLPSGIADSIESILSGQSDTVDKIKDQFDGFVDMLEKQLHEIPAGTAIAIFALGVLMGRLLPR